MRQNAVGEKILGCARKAHRSLGPGLLENAYEACLAYALVKPGLDCRRQLAMPVHYGDVQVELGHRLDLLVEDLVVVGIKAVERLGGFRIGYVLNFNVTTLKDGIWRVANGP